jgi:glycosyltransferase involved in cell wall biosynthesis
MASKLLHLARHHDLVDVAGFDLWPYARLARAVRPQQGLVCRSNGLWFKGLEADVGPGRTRSPLSTLVQRGLFCRWERLSACAADAMRVVSSPDARAVATLGWKRQDQIFVAHPGVDNCFDVPGYPADRRGVAFLGSWLERKGRDVVASVFERILRERPGVPVALLGVGLERRSLAARFPGLSDRRIEFLERASPQILASALARYAVLLFPTRYEGFGMVVAESMRAGLAVVTTRTGAGLDFVDDGSTGLLVPADDARTALAAVYRLLDDDALRARIGAAARDRARAITWRATAAALVSCYEFALRSARERSTR